MDFILNALLSSWDILLDTAPFALLGFFAAGLFKAFLPDDFVNKHLGGSGPWPVFKAALLGAPLPLCSCGVVPAVAGLKNQGAGKGASASFLIATPETGVDSMAVTYALLDPFMTLVRPLAAIITASLAGLMINATEKKEQGEPFAPMEHSACCSTCACHGQTATRPTKSQKFLSGMKFAFGELLRDIGGWLLVGLVLAGLISSLIPDGFIENSLGGGFLQMLVMLGLGIPMYVCATSSTPIAAALALKGASPGAALVFLLAGPATNIATLTLVLKVLGRRAAAVYLAAIILCALGLGLVTNQIYLTFGMSVSDWIQAGEEQGLPILSHLAALLLLGLIAFNHIRAGVLRSGAKNIHSH